jgi:hypothetical protein
MAAMQGARTMAKNAKSVRKSLISGLISLGETDVCPS